MTTMKQPLLPEATRMSLRDAVNLNAWAAVAVAAAFLSRLFLKNSPELAGSTRVIVALLPLAPSLLYVRAIWQWIQSLDEMQQKLQLEAVSFAALIMLLVALGLDLARVGGFTSGLTLGWEGYFASTFCLWALGLARANRRYQ